MSFTSINPTTGEVLNTYPEHSQEEVETRLQSAWDGWQRWSKTPLSERTGFLLRLADLLEQRADEYGRLITLEMGKPIGEAVNEVKKAATGARHFAQEGPAYLAPERIPGMPGRIEYQSLGPILAIMPWNLPFWQVLRFFIPTAMVGNSVVVKHAETVQGCALAIEKLISDAGAPEGLYVNLSVQREAAPKVIADPRIRAVTVTGSVAAGRAVAEIAGRYGKKVVLELGGSDPFIVLEDADLAKAAQLGVVSRYSNNAQSCIAAKRFFIAEQVAETFTKAFLGHAAGLKVGDPLLTETKLGPLARKDLLANTERQVKAAVAEGASVLLGGKALEGPGYFYPPTVLSGLPHDAAVAGEEFFGPVALFYTFKTEEEAIQLANDSEFGLGASVWSQNSERANAVALQLEAGAVFLNDFVRSDPRAPFGGMKASGFGRELGGLGARELTNAKFVWEQK
ncbi:Succinate-semialdehyde dehydrogenase [NAD] [Acidisarcina polymorpha]|uniref:Succinate-semialdehyde dehydrogenase [NAD] n=1 Tax=Acidisarcina polymorpha TaxID=2211140 RepID=A0A2Z5G0A4_9BACT|nr:NAD-dependent succinate-semialdehyde dehydrogenase [Acidisarcina polymorpha]AXC12591.1 Succinate-semialdehyde dehydrogenase [NAD] [Acidisarcina polymorpha]